MNGIATRRVHMHFHLRRMYAEPCNWSDSPRTHVQGSKAIANNYRHTGVDFEP